MTHRTLSALGVVAALAGLCGCEGGATALEPVVDLPEICAAPLEHAGQTVELELTGIQRSETNCTGIACGPSAPCCNTCDSYYILPCSGGGVVALIQLPGFGFSCFGNDCGLTCDPVIVPSDTLRITATIGVGFPPLPCCTPIRFGVVDAVATLDIISYELVHADAGP